MCCKRVCGGGCKPHQVWDIYRSSRGATLTICTADGQLSIQLSEDGLNGLHEATRPKHHRVRKL